MEGEEDRRKIIESIHGQAHLYRKRQNTFSANSTILLAKHVQDSMCLRKFQIYLVIYSAGVWCIERYFSSRLLHVTTASAKTISCIKLMQHFIPFLLKKKPAWYQVGMDLVGPLPVTPACRKRVLDDNYRLLHKVGCIAAALKDKTALIVSSQRLILGIII